MTHSKSSHLEHGGDMELLCCSCPRRQLCLAVVLRVVSGACSQRRSELGCVSDAVLVSNRRFSLQAVNNMDKWT